MQRTLVILRGASGSGKTTRARALIQPYLPHAVIVSRDIIRKMLGATGKTVLDSEQETLVTHIEHDLIREACYRGDYVVVDDTNTFAKNVNSFANLGFNLGYSVYIIAMDTPYDVCVARSPLPEAVVRRQFDRVNQQPVVLTRTPVRPVEQDKTLPRVFLFDMDGTLSIIDPENPRDPYDASRAHEDLEVGPVATVFDEMSCVDKIITTGRFNRHLGVTEKWLNQHGLNDYKAIYTRADGDHRQDAAVKYDMLQEIVKKHYVIGVFDDREQVIDMWRTAGIHVFDVGQEKAKF